MKKILLIHTGGTFGMVPVEPEQTLAPGNLQNQLQQHVPELSRLAQIDIEIPINLDSSNISIKEWDNLARLIHNRIDDYDGFVLIHGTDTMVYTAAALSFTLRNLKKPVVITGSQRPLANLRSDARINLIDAVELATMDIPEVVIVFGEKILRGNRAKKTSITSYDAFRSPNYPLLGEIGLRIELNHKFMLRETGNYFYQPGFKSDVLILNIFPAMKPDFYKIVLNNNPRVILMVGFGAGNLPNRVPDWIPFIKDALQRDISVFMVSQSMHGSADLSIYESSRQALEAGAVGLKDMTIESSYVKILKILAQTSESSTIKKLLLDNWAGEITS